MVRLFSFLLAVVHSSVLAQDSGDRTELKSSLTFSTGLVHVRTINEGLSFSKILFTGNGVPLTFCYRLESSKHATKLLLHYFSAGLSHSGADIPVTLRHGLVSLTHTRNIKTFTIGRKTVRLSTGLIAGTNINLFQSPSLDNDDVVVINAIHVVLQTHVILNEKSTLSFSIEIPTVALAKRLTLDGGLHEPASNKSSAIQILFGDGKVIFANTYAFNSEYSKRLSNTIDWVAAYKINYLKNKQTETLKLYTNEISTGFRFNL